jgi:arsenate reductase-like glutaredoxin family protein
MRIANCPIIITVLLLSFITMSFVTIAQPPAIKKDYKPGILSVAYFIESANNSVNSLTSLLKKDNYRNRITTLNNPVNNELGFSLKNEILTALKPILDKVKKTDGGKFRDVIENFLTNPEENGIKSVKKYLPSLGIFSTVLSLVGNLVIVEKSITKEDLNKFIAKVQQYFYQYEKLNAINEQFGDKVEKMLERSDEIKEDLKEFLEECITTMNKSIIKLSLKDIPVEVLIQKYYDPQKLQIWLDTNKIQYEFSLYPPDAPTSVKLITSGIKRIQKEFETIYNENYTEMKELIASLKITIPGLDQNQLNKTSAEIDQLYNDSRQADAINLNITQVNERMNIVCSIINSGK